MAGSKGARVVDFWETIGPRGGWNFSFERHFNDWELEAIQSFLCTINSRSIRPQIKDKLSWKEAKSGIYSVKSCFDMLEGGRQHPVPVKMLWNPVVPSKVVFFT